MRQLTLGVRLRERAGFDNFHPGGNGFAVGVLRELAAGQRRGVFWLAGGPASGRTHLLQAVCAATGEGGAAYLPLRQLASAGPEVLGGWQASACVCVDDVDLVLGQMAWERALFSLHRELDERGASLLLAATLPPRALSFALADFGSRCAHALLLTLEPLDEDGQRQALQVHAAHRGIELPDDVALYLLRRLPRDMERLCAWLDTLDDAALTAQRRLTIPFVREVLGGGAD